MRYIDADALIKKLFPYDVVDKKDYTINAKAVADAIAKTPSADVVPRAELAVRSFQDAATIHSLSKKLAEVKSEVIDEFAERIKKEFTAYPYPISYLEIEESGFCKIVDRLAKEMKGGAE